MKKNTDKTTIRLPEKLGYATISVADNLLSSFKATFLLFFGTNVLGVSPALMGILSSIVLIWDAINDPLMAYYADTHPNRKGDRCKQYLWAGIPLGIVLSLMFTKFTQNAVISAIILFVLMILYDLFATMYRMPFFTMMILVSPHEKDRISVNQWHFLGTSIGTAMGALVMWPLVRRFGGVDEAGNLINAEKGFFVGAVIVAATLIFFCLYHYFTTKERVRAEQGTAEIPFLEACKILFRNMKFRRNCFTYFFINLIPSAIVTYGLYYATYVIRQPAMLTLLNAAYMLVSMIAVVFSGKLVKKLGRNKSMSLGAFALIVSEVFFIVMARQLVGGMVLVVVAGFSFSLFNISNSMYRAEIADEIEQTEGRRVDSMISNVTSFAVKCSGSLVTLMFGWILEFSGYDANLDVQPESAVNGIIFILGWFVMFACIGIILSLPRVKKVKAAAADGE